MIKRPELNDRFRLIRRLKVIEVLCCRGEGTSDDPCRMVHKYYEEDGLKLIAETDDRDITSDSACQ